MAQAGIMKAFLIAAVLAIFSAAAQGIGSSPAPAPDAGSAITIPVSGALIAASLLVSSIAFLRH
nr:hypothetical protein B456_002G152900 [Ipomoea trifida]GMD00175.1 Arabinogalactan protein 40 precursor [Ipomoea batatas]